jgi:hypothetical protein
MKIIGKYLRIGLERWPFEFLSGSCKSTNLLLLHQRLDAVL